MTKKQITYSLEQIDEIAAQLADMVPSVAIMTFVGPLGAGKTTMVRSLLRASGVQDTITSPTYTYLNIYRNPDGFTFYHFDLYRIVSLDDFINAGFNEYLYQPNSIALIEWPEIIDPLLMDRVCRVSIDYYASPRVGSVVRERGSENSAGGGDGKNRAQNSAENSDKSKSDGAGERASGELGENKRVITILCE
jgi:tRNA threonylcarbamoyladenosine biosynthesis protein TsaE